MNVKTIGDITSMMVIYLLLYSAQFQSLPDSFRIITLHYSWLRSSDNDDDDDYDTKSATSRITDRIALVLVCTRKSKTSYEINIFSQWFKYIANYRMIFFINEERGEKKGKARSIYILEVLNMPWRKSHWFRSS